MGSCAVSPCGEPAAWRVTFHPPHFRKHSADYCPGHARPFVRQLCSVPTTADPLTTVDDRAEHRYDGGVNEECPHGMEDPAWCTLCTGKGRLGGPEPLEVEVTFAARFGGDCPGCDLPIYPGQVIGRMSDGSYRHAEGCT